MQKQKFYIIAHNPNTLQEAAAFMQAGANALEPDIRFDADKPDRFFVSHGGLGSNPLTHEHSLVTYMVGLRKLITDGKNKFNLALLAFDVKTPKSDINEFIKIVFENFSNFPVCSGVAILITVSSVDDIGFLTAYDQTRANVGVGVDEHKVPLQVANKFKGAAQKKFAYANGIIAPGIKLGVFKTIMEAKGLQAKGDGASFQLIHTWVLASESSMRSYLDLHIDGIIVNLGTVPQLVKILKEKHFLPMYELAQNGHNPWGALPRPTYLLTIKTRNKLWAGTDVPITFKLTGSGGSAETSLDSGYKGVLEEGGTDFLTLEGTNIGNVSSLKITALKSDSNSDWLPELIELTGNLLAAPLTFHYGPDEWLKFGHPITKTPS